MRRTLAWGLLIVAGLPLFLGITYLLVSGFGTDFDSFIALIIGLVGLGAGSVLAGFGYWFLPSRQTRRWLAVAIVGLSGGLLMLLSFLLSLVAAPVAFMPALVTGLVGLVVGGVSLRMDSIR